MTASVRHQSSHDLDRGTARKRPIRLMGDRIGRDDPAAAPAASGIRRKISGG
ncbi:MAG TPA: hypothetical protein VJQ44_11260 [Gemmatimonadales bacterium]|nr:hypothetical protein [Gemmatimonadales bacterium]